MLYLNVLIFETATRQDISTMDSPERLTSKAFSEVLHTNFKVSGPDGGVVTLELVEVEERQISPRVDVFSVYFRGPGSPRLPQQIHHLEHEQMGSFDIFLTPISADEQCANYE